MPWQPPRHRMPWQPTREQLEQQRKAVYDKTRPNPTARGYDGDWRKLRVKKLAADPMCEMPGCPRESRDVDHIRSIEQHPELRLVWSNLRALCREHHSSRTARDQGFARRRPRP